MVKIDYYYFSTAKLSVSYNPSSLGLFTYVEHKEYSHLTWLKYIVYVT